MLSEYDPANDSNNYVMVNLGKCSDPLQVLVWLKPLVQKFGIPCRWTVLSFIVDSYFLLLLETEKDADRLVAKLSQHLWGKARILGRL